MNSLVAEPYMGISPSSESFASVYVLAWREYVGWAALSRRVAETIKH